MIILDVEIEKAIQIRGEPKLPDIGYCNGWRDFKGMGVACVCTYDITTNLSRAFLKEDFNALAVYLYGKWTAGFNTQRFDLPLLAEHDLHFDPAMHYDMLEEIWLALGLNPDKFNPRTHGGWGLDAVCGATLGIRKTGNGALAPVWWQQGRRGKVIDYCLNDVWMEGQLLKHVLAGKYVTNGKGDGADHELVLSRPAGWLADPAGFVDNPQSAPAGRQQGGLQPAGNAQSATIGRQYGAAQQAQCGFQERQTGDPIINESVDQTPFNTPPGGLGIVR